MNLRVCLAAMIAGTLALNASASALVKQKAKQLAQPDGQQPAAPPPYVAQSSAPRPATPAAQSPAEQMTARVIGDIAIIKTKSEVTPELQGQLFKDLTAATISTPKPTPEKVAKLTQDIASSLTNKKMSPAEQAQIGKQIGHLLNSGSMSPKKLQELLKELKEGLEMVEVKPPDAQKIIEDLHAISDELHKSPATAAGK